jgi:hypothetical protein
MGEVLKWAAWFWISGAAVGGFVGFCLGVSSRRFEVKASVSEQRKS